MVTLKNFTTTIDPKRVQDGKAYFKDGAVLDLNEAAPGEWVAAVEGNDMYETEVHLNKKFQVTLTDCDCPHDANFCKHVAAVLFAIKNELNLGDEELNADESAKTKKSASKRAKKETYKNLIQKASEKDLRAFVEKYAARNTEFRNMLMIHFSDLSDAVGVEKYSAIIKAGLKTGMDRSGFIDYYKNNKALKPTIELVKKAQQNLAAGYFREVLDISIAIITEISEIMYSIDDSNGNVMYVLESSFKFLNSIAHHSDAPVNLKEEVFQYAFTTLEKSNIHQSDIYTYYTNLMAESAVATGNFKPALEQVEKQLEKISKASGDNSNKRYREEHLLQLKMDLLKESGNKDASEDVIIQNLHIPEFRISLVKKHIALKEFSKAKELINEGLKNKAELYPRAEHDLMDLLLEVAEKEKDIDAVRRIGMKLFFDNHHEMKYYRKIKSTYNESEWKLEAEVIINKIIKNQNRYFFNTKPLSNIYIEEQYWERLLGLCENIHNPDNILDFEKYLRPRFPEEFYNMLRKALNNYAHQNQGRNHYVYLRDFLKQISSTTEGKNLAMQLATFWRTQYKMRPAMLQELGKLPF